MKAAVCRVVAFAGVALLTGACSSSAHAGRGADSPDAVVPTGPGSTAPHVGGGGGGSPVVSATASAAATAPGVPVPSGSSAASASTARTTSGAHHGAALTPAGVYHYRLHGTQSSSLGSESLDDDPTLTVDVPSNERQHSTLAGKDNTTEQTLQATSGGLRLVDLRLSQEGIKAEFRPATPVLLLPATPVTGQHWRWSMTSTDGKYSLHATLRITDASGETVVRGQTVHTIAVSSVLHITGSGISVTIHQDDRGARDGLIVSEHAVGDGTYDGIKFHTDTRRTLTSAPR